MQDGMTSDAPKVVVNRRWQYLWLAATGTLVLLSVIGFDIYSDQVRRAKVEREVAASLGVTASWEAIDAYIESQLAVGHSEDEVRAVIDRIDPQAMGPFGVNPTYAGSECYLADFRRRFLGWRWLNRVFCIGPDGRVNEAFNELVLY
jgi:hypothetical protein